MSKKALQALLRNDLSAFVEKTFNTTDASQMYIRSGHTDLIAKHLEDCESGKIKRLIITMPPRSLKSLCVSVAFPAWLLGRDPSRRIINVSYSDDLSSKLARDCRSVMESDWYKDTFLNTRINPKKRSENEFETTANGYRLSTSVGGTLTGRGGSFIIIDDPLKPQDAMSDTKRNNANQWFSNTLYSRQDNKQTGCIIIVMQRVHVEDLVDYVQSKEDWTVLNLPAIAEETEIYPLKNGRIFKRIPGDILNAALDSKETLDKIKATLGSYNFSAQYQQQPVPAEGNVIKWQWFKQYDTIIKEDRSLDRIIQSWDTAMKEYDGNDYSVCVTIRQIGQKYYILDIYRERLSFPALKKKIKEKKEEFEARVVLIEDKSSGTPLIQQLESEGFYVIAYEPQGAKEDRIVAQSAIIESGRVFIPKEAPWLGDFKSEVLSFPYSRHDDQLDALSQGLDWLYTGLSILDVL